MKNEVVERCVQELSYMILTKHKDLYTEEILHTSILAILRIVGEGAELHFDVPVRDYVAVRLPRETWEAIQQAREAEDE